LRTHIGFTRTACFLSGISGWFSLSLNPLARGCRRNLARRKMVSAGAMLLDRLGPPGRCSGCRPHDGEVAGGAVADLVLLISGPPRYPPRVNLNSHPYARAGADGQAVVCPLLRGRSPTRWVAPKQHWESLVYEESDSKERLRVSNWIVQRLYNYAVKKTVEL
jgi:hypothetical protein